MKCNHEYESKRQTERVKNFFRKCPMYIFMCKNGMCIMHIEPKIRWKLISVMSFLLFCGFLTSIISHSLISKQKKNNLFIRLKCFDWPRTLRFHSFETEFRCSNIYCVQHIFVDHGVLHMINIHFHYIVCARLLTLNWKKKIYGEATNKFRWKNKAITRENELR